MNRLWFACTVLALVSCSRDGGNYGEHPPFPTSGRVIVNGEPVKGAVVRFFHLGDWGEQQAVVPMGSTDENGKFVLETYARQDGAPTGDYNVTVEWPAPETRRSAVAKMGGNQSAKDWLRDKLGRKFADPRTSELTAHVKEGKNVLLPFELKAELVEFPPDPPKKGGGKQRNGE